MCHQVREAFTECAGQGTGVGVLLRIWEHEASGRGLALTAPAFYRTAKCGEARADVGIGPYELLGTAHPAESRRSSTAPTRSTPVLSK